MHMCVKLLRGTRCLRCSQVTSPILCHVHVCAHKLVATTSRVYRETSTENMLWPCTFMPAVQCCGHSCVQHLRVPARGSMPGLCEHVNRETLPMAAPVIIRDPGSIEKPTWDPYGSERHPSPFPLHRALQEHHHHDVMVNAKYCTHTRHAHWP